MSLAQNISFDYNSKEIECDDWSVCSMKTSTSVPSGQLSALTKTAYASTHEATTSVRSCAAQMASRRPQQQVARTGESTSHLRFFSVTALSLSFVVDRSFDEVTFVLNVSEL